MPRKYKISTTSSLKGQFIAEHLFLTKIKDKSLEEQIALLFSFYAGLSALEISQIEIHMFSFKYEVPFLYLNGKAIFLKGPLLKALEKFINTFTTTEHHRTLVYPFSITDHKLANTARKTWEFAVNQTYNIGKNV